MKRKADVFGPLCDYARTQPCVVNMCFGRTEPHHVRSRGSGGNDYAGRKGDPSHGNVVSLCRTHHTEGHTIGWGTFQARYHLNLNHEAEKLYRRWVG